ncbi:Formyltransferase [Parathielavia hyrcaniae]|uniref:methionyl-tRNA formyltransferase n=1 Tax=Parathielavia hyrcaniae TaxID=113614 RepID=A0AAN6Q6Q6_9PEZI|nr:Formyltransferase [Parathielavia hyrcaniae]
MLGRQLAWSLRSAARPATARWRLPYSTSTAPKKSDPLRILFCGSDDFSCHSLRALHDEQKRNADLVRSIDVVVRPSKSVGRGHKVLREVPARKLAAELQLPIHVRDTFTGWDLPKPNGDPINLIIAVSFGLFVPPRLLNATKYGGLNVHPSLLPDLRGPAPLHHTLLSNRSHTGLTIQTLSPHAFDEGIPLLQTPRPGIPIPPDCTLTQLHALLAPRGAEVLVEALRASLHVPPHEPCSPYPYPPRAATAHAPKITAADREVRWDEVVGAGEVVRRARVLGPLWTREGRMGLGGESGKRVILDELSEVVVGVEEVGAGCKKRQTRAGMGYWADGEGGVLVPMRDVTWLRIGRIKLEGSVFKPAETVLLAAELMKSVVEGGKHGQ